MLERRLKSNGMSDPTASWIWTVAAAHRSVRPDDGGEPLDDDTIELIHQLCARIGMMMEDASVGALVSRSDDDLTSKIVSLRLAIEQASALVAAAQALCAD